MLDYKKALELILSFAHEFPAEKVILEEALMRVLASGIFCDTDMPPFDKSAMDGYACRERDLNNLLEVIETIPAGKMPGRMVGENQCSKIMTGAMVPAGADFVIQKEDTQAGTDERIYSINRSAKNHILYKGSDMRQGDEVLSKATLLLARHLPVMAGAGIIHPKVFCRPSVAVLATGTELVDPEKQPLPFQIRNSNSVQLLAQLTSMNVIARFAGIVADDEYFISSKIEELCKIHEVIIVTGGVSVGDFDLVPESLESSGFQLPVTSVSIKPGKPLVFAVKGKRYCFGLSGNPVSSYIQFELFVKPFLYKLMGHLYQPVLLRLPLGDTIIQQKSDRVNFIPAVINAVSEAVPVDFHGSAHVHALAEATHLIEIRSGTEKITKGDLVNVRSL
jgi:molybdopterin molybdotransferase